MVAKSPTTGLTAILVARQLCSRVTVYGEGCPECGYYAPRRRTGKRPPKGARGAEQFGTHFQTKFHNMSAEARAFQRLTGGGLSIDAMRQSGRFEVQGCLEPAGTPQQAPR